MKRVIICMLLCIMCGILYVHSEEDIPTQTYGEKNVNVSLTFTKGVEYTLTPIADLGVAKENGVTNGNSYTVSDASAFTISKSTHNNAYDVYKLKGKKVGTFTFTAIQYYGGEAYYKNGVLTYRWKGTVKYTIKVVDLSKITIPSSISLVIGKTYTITPQLTPSDAVNTLTWSSSNTNVATVSKGTITAKGVGTATITCKADNGVSATCKVTVTPILVTGVSLNKTSATVNCGSTLQLTATVTPSNATNKTVNWKSSNTSVATVNSSGLVTTKTPGQCTITATAADGSGKSASCTVTVKPVLITDIKLNQTESELFLGEKLQLTATVSPSNATNKTLTWSSSNDHVAIVNESGMVSSVASGQCVIHVSANDGSDKKATCKVTVVNDILSIDDAIAVPSGTMTLPVYLKNESQITGLQFDLQVPEGVSVAESNGQLLANMSDRANDQSISGTKVSDNLYRFVVFSSTSKAFSGSSGAIAYITLNMDSGMAVGEYALALKGIELTKIDGTSIHHRNMTSKLTLTEVKMGDTNGDGSVTVTDAVGIVNTILGRTPSVFISNAADVDGNGSVTISDAVGIINMILNK